MQWVCLALFLYTGIYIELMLESLASLISLYSSNMRPSFDSADATEFVFHK